MFGVILCLRKRENICIYIFLNWKKKLNVIVFLYFKWYILLNIIILLKVIFYEWYFNYFLKKKYVKMYYVCFRLGNIKKIFIYVIIKKKIVILIML